MDSSDFLTAALILVGIAAGGYPIIEPATEPPDQIEYYSETQSSDYGGFETLSFDGLSDQEQRVFQGARANDSGPFVVSENEIISPPPLSKGVETAAFYDIQYQNQWYSLTVQHIDREIPGEAHFIRLSFLVSGILLLAGGGIVSYRTDRRTLPV